MVCLKCAPSSSHKILIFRCFSGKRSLGWQTRAHISRRIPSFQSAALVYNRLKYSCWRRAQRRRRNWKGRQCDFRECLRGRVGRNVLINLLKYWLWFLQSHMVPHDQPEAALVRPFQLSSHSIQHWFWSLQDLFARWIFDIPLYMDNIPTHRVTLEDLIRSQ